MASLFAHVWRRGDVVLGRSCEEALPSSQEPRAALGDRVSCTPRSASRARGRVVRISCSTARCVETSRAGGVVAATADVARRVIDDPPPATADAVEHITYGPMAVLSVLTNETQPMPWDDVYSILVVDKSFNMFFNHASALRAPGTRAARWHADGLRGRGPRAASCSSWTTRASGHDARGPPRVFPENRGIVAEVLVQRWTHTDPYAHPAGISSRNPLRRRWTTRSSSRGTTSARGPTSSRRRRPGSGGRERIELLGPRARQASPLREPQGATANIGCNRIRRRQRECGAPRPSVDHHVLKPMD